MNTILTSIKDQLGISEEDISFDSELIPLINAQFLFLKRMGVGPENGYRITNEDNVWSEFTDNPSIADTCITYIYAKIKPVFDPSTSATVTDALKQIAAEAEYTLRLELDL